MTISLVWIRRISGCEELVIATDSRLSFGCRWDCCPKIIALPRNDSAICFAGDTMYAYPVMIQAVSAVAQHSKLLSRALDLEDLKGHLLRILNNMTSLVHDLPKGINNEPETTFLLAGWSWKRSCFKVWLLYYDPNIKRFTFRPTRNWTGDNKDKLYAVIGDYTDEFKQRLINLLRAKSKLQNGGFDMEPFEVLRDMLREKNFDLIGGAPQLMKVHKYANCRPFAVFWPSKDSQSISILGRPLLDYESSQYLVLDPDTFETTKHIDIF